MGKVSFQRAIQCESMPTIRALKAKESGLDTVSKAVKSAKSVKFASSDGGFSDGNGVQDDKENAIPVASPVLKKKRKVVATTKPRVSARIAQRKGAMVETRAAKKKKTA